MKLKQILPMATLGAIVAVAGCTSTDESPESEGTSTSTSSEADSPARTTTKVASDGGKATIGTTAATPVEKSEYGPSISTPIAVEVTNRSETDLLYFANVELTLRGSGGDKVVRPHNDVHMVLPGETTIYGYVDYPEFSATELDGEFTDTQWYQMSSLKKLGIDLGIEMTQSKIDANEHSVAATGEFNINVDPKDDRSLSYFKFFKRVMIRNSDGELLGVFDEDGVYAHAKSAGTYTVEIDVDKDEWPPNADPNKSRVVVSWFDGFNLDD